MYSLWQLAVVSDRTIVLGGDLGCIFTLSMFLAPVEGFVWGFKHDHLYMMGLEILIYLLVLGRQCPLIHLSQEQNPVPRQLKK